MKKWTPEDRLRFDIEMALKRSARIKRRHPGDDPFGSIARELLEHFRICGWRMESTLATFEPIDMELEESRTMSAEAWAAMRLVRDALEQHCPPGAVPSEETVVARVAPTLMAEAEAMVTAIEKLAESKPR